MLCSNRGIWMFLLASSCRVTEDPAGPSAFGNADGLGMKTLYYRRPKKSRGEGFGETWPPASSGPMTVPWWLGLSARRDRWGRGRGRHLSFQHPKRKSSPKLEMLRSKPAEVRTCSALHKPLQKRFGGTIWRERWQRDAMEFPVSFVGSSCKGMTWSWVIATGDGNTNMTQHANMFKATGYKCNCFKEKST